MLNTALAHMDDETPVLRFRGSETLRDQDLGIFEILLSQSGTAADVGAGGALSAIGRVLLARYADEVPIVLLDNANLVDARSLSVLIQLAVARRVKLLIAAESIRPPLDLATNLWLSGGLIRVDLSGLDEATVAALSRTIGVTRVCRSVGFPPARRDWWEPAAAQPCPVQPRPPADPQNGSCGTSILSCGPCSKWSR